MFIYIGTHSPQFNRMQILHHCVLKKVHYPTYEGNMISTKCASCAIGKWQACRKMTGRHWNGGHHLLCWLPTFMVSACKKKYSWHTWETGIRLYSILFISFPMWQLTSNNASIASWGDYHIKDQTIYSCKKNEMFRVSEELLWLSRKEHGLSNVGSPVQICWQRQ